MNINVNYKNGKRVRIPQAQEQINRNDFELGVRLLAKDIKTKPFFSKVYGLNFEEIRSVTVTG